MPSQKEHEVGISTQLMASNIRDLTFNLAAKMAEVDTLTARVKELEAANGRDIQQGKFPPQ